MLPTKKCLKKSREILCDKMNKEKTEEPVVTADDLPISFVVKYLGE